MRKGYLILMVLLVSTSFYVPRLCGSTSIVMGAEQYDRKVFRKAVELMTEKKWDEAIRELENIIEVHSGQTELESLYRVRAKFFIGSMYFKKKMYTEALEILKNTLPQFDSFADKVGPVVDGFPVGLNCRMGAMGLIAATYGTLGDLEKCEKWYGETISILRKELTRIDEQGSKYPYPESIWWIEKHYLRYQSVTLPYYQKKLAKQYGREVFTLDQAIDYEKAGELDKAIEAYIQLLGYDNYWESMSALVRIGKPAIGPLIEAFKRDATGRVSTVFSEMGDEAIEPLLPFLKDPDPIRRGYAAWALGRIGAEEVTPLLIKQFVEDRWSVFARRYAAYGLGHGKVKAAVPCLIEALNDPNEPHIIRGTAGEALANIGDERAYATFLDLLTSKYIKYRALSATGLGNIGNPAAIDPLIEIMKNDPHERVRLSAVSSLKKLGGEKVLQAFEEVLLGEHTSKNVRSGVVTALRRTGDEKALQTLEKAATEENCKEAWNAIKTAIRDIKEKLGMLE